jgi:peptide/nickel transport system permease protein
MASGIHPMLGAVARRLGEFVLTMFATSIVIFGSLYLVPGSPVAYLARGRDTDASVIARIKSQYHLNDPFYQRYWDWLTGLFRGDLGRSLVSNETTWNLLRPRLEPTLALVILATLETAVVGVILGCAAGLGRRGTDRVITVTATIGVGVPSFAAAALLISVFAVNLGWFPATGAGSGFTDILWHVFLPSVALAISGLAYVTRLTRSSVREERSREYVETATAQGMPRSSIIRRHILRNSAPSILTAIGVSFVGLMASEVVVESAFGINGIGSFLVQEVEAKDFAVVQVIVLLYVAVFMLVNTVVDLLAMAVDPRLGKQLASV